MNASTVACIAILSLAGSATLPAAAQTAGAGMVPGDGVAAFRFATTVKTPKGSHAGSGTVTIKRAGTREVNVTVKSDDGSPAHTIALIVGVDGSVAPDPANVPPAASDPAAQAQAAAFMAEMTTAAHVGIGARKNAGGAAYSVPVKLTPVGNGAPVATQLAMTGTAAQYTGATSGQTQTELPQGGSLDPAEIAKTIGISSFARHAFTPAGRVATGVIVHRKRKEQKAEAAGLLPDTIRLTVTADLADGKIREIRGAQSDDITLGGKSVQIQSSWTFTKLTGAPPA